VLICVLIHETMSLLQERALHMLRPPQGPHQALHLVLVHTHSRSLRSLRSLRTAECGVAVCSDAGRRGGGRARQVGELVPQESSRGGRSIQPRHCCC
jgi:hypothetical protein